MNYQIKAIVAGVSELDSADPVLRFGLDLVKRLGSTCHFVHAYLPPLDPLDTAPPAMAEAGAPGLAVGPAEIEQLGREIQARFEFLISAAPFADRTKVHAVHGPSHQALVRTAVGTRADLIVMGATGRSRIGQAVLGTTASHTLHEARTPVMVLRKVPRQSGTRILLTTDLSELGAKACTLAIRACRTLFGEDSVFRCLLAVGGGGGDLPPIDTEELRASADAKLRDFVDRVTGSGAGFTVEPIVRVGDAADEIVAETEQWPVDVLALGTHGRSGLSSMLLGSVAQAALRDIKCTALVIPAAVVADYPRRDPPAR